MIRRFVPYAGADLQPPVEFLVSVFYVERRGGHDHCRLWSRGGLAGELVLDAGDGGQLALMLGLVEAEVVS